MRRFILAVAFLSTSFAQVERVAPTWLHRNINSVAARQVSFSNAKCVYKPLFGEGDSETRTLLTVARFGEATVAGGDCGHGNYPRQEELYYVLEGSGTLHYSEKAYPLRAGDFTYLPPGAEHWLANSSSSPMTAVVMGFTIDNKIAIEPPPADVKVANIDSVKEEPVQGHPLSVLYKLLAGPREGTRDVIDQAYVMVSLFVMDFAPGGTNAPHHHPFAEEVYLVLDGSGEMVAGGGIDGIEGRHTAGPGDAYYFRPNCTVGFYNRNAPGAKAHILAVRSRIPLPAAVND